MAFTATNPTLHRIIKLKLLLVVVFGARRTRMNEFPEESKTRKNE